MHCASILRALKSNLSNTLETVLQEYSAVFGRALNTAKHLGAIRTLKDQNTGH